MQKETIINVLWRRQQRLLCQIVILVFCLPCSIGIIFQLIWTYRYYNAGIKAVRQLSNEEWTNLNNELQEQLEKDLWGFWSIIPDLTIIPRFEQPYSISSIKPSNMNNDRHYRWSDNLSKYYRTQTQHNNYIRNYSRNIFRRYG